MQVSRCDPGCPRGGEIPARSMDHAQVAVLIGQALQPVRNRRNMEKDKKPGGQVSRPSSAPTAGRIIGKARTQGDAKGRVH